MDKPNVLSEDEVKNGLGNLPGWSYSDNKISKEFQFKDFVDSLSFVNSMVAYFETMDHHPDTFIMYSKIQFFLQRFDVGGKVTDRDLEVAKKIEENYASWKRQ
ncbi:MAG: 4a-hydroxytetrahydrobiopterin dehydratase [Acidobacteriaceae bacterium]